MIILKINGTEEILPNSVTLLQYLQQKQYAFERIAVEYNGRILTRLDYETIVLDSGDVVEIVSFVGGG